MQSFCVLRSCTKLHANTGLKVFKSIDCASVADLIPVDVLPHT